MENTIRRIQQKMAARAINTIQPISIEQIRDFEQTNNIALPEELVLFYTQISNGCEMIDGFDLYSFEKWKYHSECLNEPFPFTELWIWEDEDIKDCETDERFKALDYGNIELIDIGCCQTWNIIVQGDEKGKMWEYADVGITPCYPEMTFLKWFEYWLDGNDDFFYEYENEDQ